ncbi:hypothetical protein JG688_00009217 [Phytophthora aleatoria]|uniref:Uncharacterized protein n=1 Tax=Phytophthora aleatoria TaxID=2496075 RepID=A0A8J5M455_9STRA|nr:hypothetical protein JG688_00009217 [Phytophthora aleatoria]
MHDNDGRETHKESVIIPMGAVLSNGENYSIKLGAAGSDEIRLRYEHTAMSRVRSLECLQSLHTTLFPDLRYTPRTVHSSTT